MDASNKRSSPLQRKLIDEPTDDEESALPDLQKKTLIGYQQKKKKKVQELLLKFLKLRPLCPPMLSPQF